ncbi:MAG: UDP-N-acetylmuramoyl-tripeptide--D-alanyl-D-alanine ligase, partial [Flavobacteriales bacterium]|nr:UDP-N-acetylmuramoyl-tripeptide--D-alanyl-D-alanine ligase [Flavobacteriales bacterium]
MTTIDTLHDHFLKCTGVCTDTRSITPGCLFVALKGPNFNANAFAEEALEKGARYAIVDDPEVAQGERFLLVADGLAALQQLATYHRRAF